MIETMDTMMSAPLANCRPGLIGGISVLAAATAGSGAAPDDAASSFGVDERNQRLRRHRGFVVAWAAAVIRCR
jgi:hypothetical protein